MSGLDIEAIRARWEKYGIDNRGSGQVAAFGWNGAAHASAGDVPALLEQIERDRAALDEAVASVREQAAEIERLRANLDDAGGQLDLLDSELVSANSQRDQARAALADALQVLADLRGGTP